MKYAVGEDGLVNKRKIFDKEVDAIKALKEAVESEKNLHLWRPEYSWTHHHLMR